MKTGSRSSSYRCIFDDTLLQLENEAGAEMGKFSFDPIMDRGLGALTVTLFPQHDSHH